MQRFDRELDHAVRSLHAAKTVETLALIASNLAVYRKKLLLAETSQATVNELVGRLSSLSITDAEMIRIREADTRLRVATVVLQAQATQIELRLVPDAVGLVRMNGRDVTTSAQILIEDTTLTIQGIGELLVKPGIQNRETQLALLEQERQELRDALRKASAASVEQAEETCAARKACESDLAQARHELSGYVMPDLSQKLGPGVEALRNHIAVLQTRLDLGLDGAPLTSLTELSLAQASLYEAEIQEQEAKNSAALARAPIHGLEETHTERLRAHAKLDGEKTGAHEEHSRLSAACDQRLLGESTEALAERYRSANGALLSQKLAVDALTQAQPPETVATLDSRIARYETALKSYARERQQDQQLQAVLCSRIEQEEGVGIEEQVAAAQHKVDSLDRQCGCFQREIKVLELLLNSLEQAEREAKERYMAPVVQRITPYLQTLFPGAAIHCDEQFKVTGIIRELQQKEHFEGLSIGTQEQIAVLTRLAFAEMLLERGKPATVILDDALVYSDPERMERMFDLLSQAAQRTQVLILTCREDLFTRLGGTRLRIARG